MVVTKNATFKVDFNVFMGILAHQVSAPIMVR